MKITLLIFFLIFSTVMAVYSEMIDGPAPVFTSIDGKEAGILDDGAPVKVLSRQGDWAVIEMKCRNESNTSKLSIPLQKNLFLFRNMYGRYGYLNAGSSVEVRYDETSGTMYITGYTMKDNLKDDVRYFKNYQAKVIERNRADFTFNSPMDKQIAMGMMEKYERPSSTAEVERGRLFVEVGSSKGSPTLVRSFEIISSGGSPLALEVVDSWRLDARGYLKEYHTGYIQNTEAYYAYYRNGAYRIFKSSYDIFAPASLATTVTYMVPLQDGTCEIAFSIEMDFTMQTNVKALSVVKHLNEGQDTGNGSVYRVETSGIDDAFAKLKENKLYPIVEDRPTGIDFAKEKAWMKELLKG